MQKHETGKGSYGYSYENQIENRSGKPEYHKYISWFDDPSLRDMAMNATRRSLPKARKFKRVGR